MYLSYPLILAFFKRSQENNQIIGLLGCSFILLIIYKIIANQGFSIIPRIIPLIGYIFYFILGMYLRSNYEQVLEIRISTQTRIVVLLLLITGTIIGIVNFIQQYFVHNPLGDQFTNQVFFSGIWAVLTSLSFVVTILVLLNVAKKLENNKSRTITWLSTIGTLSFGIYLVHAFVLTGFKFLGKSIGFTGDNLLYFPIMLIMTLFTSYLAVVLINKLPNHHYIIGR